MVYLRREERDWIKCLGYVFGYVCVCVFVFVCGRYQISLNSDRALVLYLAIKLYGTFFFPSPGFGWW